MILAVYSIKDSKSGYFQPTFELNDAIAMRNFEHACQNTQSLFFTHPADYSLYRIGTFNTDSGLLTKCDPEFICDATGGVNLV